jgi:hypothetical protein
MGHVKHTPRLAETGHVSALAVYASNEIAPTLARRQERCPLVVEVHGAPVREGAGVHLDRGARVRRGFVVTAAGNQGQSQENRSSHAARVAPCVEVRP